MVMFLSTKERLLREQRKNAELRSELEQVRADLDYTSMMANIDIPVEEEPMNGGTDNE